MAGLRKESTAQHRVLGVVHTDCVEEELVQAMVHTATTVVTVEKWG